MSMAVDVAVMGAVYNKPAVARDMLQTATAGAIISATDAARQSMPVDGAAAASGTYSTGNQAMREALANTSVQAQQTLMQLASQNQLLETLAHSL
jgi:hypothetical protein